LGVIVSLSGEAFQRRLFQAAGRSARIPTARRGGRRSAAEPTTVRALLEADLLAAIRRAYDHPSLSKAERGFFIGLTSRLTGDHPKSTTRSLNRPRR
jgi:hypothetical protein